MYKSNSNFGAGCPNWANWADVRFGFVHSTDIIEQNKSVYHNQDTSTHIWWIGIENLFLKRHLMVHRVALPYVFLLYSVRLVPTSKIQKSLCKYIRDQGIFLGSNRNQTDKHNLRHCNLLCIVICE